MNGCFKQVVTYTSYLLGIILVNIVVFSAKAFLRLCVVYDQIGFWMDFDGTYLENTRASTGH